MSWFDSKPRQMTREEMVAFKEIKKRFDEQEEEFDAGKPSSKVGRDIYIGRRGVLDFPFYVLGCVLHWLRGDKVWYSDDGVRHVRSTVWIRHD